MKEKRKRSNSTWRRLKLRYLIILLPCIAFAYFICNRPPQIYVNHNGNDVLYYHSDNLLMKYDPRTQTHQEVMSTPRDFIISRNGKIAYHNDANEFIVSETDNIDVPIAIIPTQSSKLDLLSWSPDGKYLAYTDQNNSANAQIFVWDGTMSIDITPENSHVLVNFYLSWEFANQIVWNDNNEFAFMASFADGVLPAEIYYWDTENTYNLSQNPEGRDSIIGWSPDGQFAFWSTKGDISHELQLKLWDGFSLVDDLPYITTIKNVPPTHASFDFATWTPDNHLIFRQSDYQLLRWNGSQIQSIVKDNEQKGSRPTFNSHGDWAFTEWWSDSIYVVDKHNRHVMTIRGWMQTWSEDGYLAFCYPGSNALLLYNGTDIITVNENSSHTQFAQWQSGQALGCHNG